ncbi:hypothetical protein B566_EDAN006521 [Ephemera danica]|nr:hypothetical protein B566_EDAN006521 [Ephemera danica]
MEPNCNYKLNNVLLGHTLDVRGLAVALIGDDSKIVSASRDTTAKVWDVSTAFNPEPEMTLKGHEKYVNCVCVLPATTSHPQLVFTGSNDNTICCFSLDSGEILYRLVGHQNAVCCLWAGRGDRVLSSSWDGTARVWLGQKEVAKLEGHELSVWAVTELPESGKLVTACADKTIKVWTETTCDHTLTGHEDCVRGLAPLSAAEFFSCANDATVRLWRVSGECLGVFYGHSNYIYSVAALPGGGFVSCGEDHTVRVWKANGDTAQVLQIPAQSVWCVVALPSGDIAAGSSDGTVRVFSQDTARHASEDTQITYSQEVESFFKTTKMELGGVKVTDLPGKEALYAPGTQEGQTKMVREGDKVICYQWSSAKCQWDIVGEAVGAGPQATEGKTTFKGKEYDFVFSVDIEDGKPPLKLPYDKNEDPWVAAQKFIHDNDLSQMFLDTIANFIIKNSGGAQQGPAAGGSQYVDPFTGGSRYVPGGASGSARSAPAAANPDPFTGGSSYTSAAAKQTLRPALPVQSEYHLFEQANLDGITVKLQEFNKEAYQPMEEAHVTILLVNRTLFIIVFFAERLFPVLDLVRLAVRNEDINTFLCTEPYSQTLISCILRPNLTPQSPELTRLMALRLAANILAHKAGENLATKNAEFLVSIANQLSLPNTQPPPRQQVALSTLLFNLSVAALRGHPELRRVTLPISALVLQRLTDVEAMRRCLRALSNLLSEATPELINQVKEKKLSETLANLMSEPKVAEMAGQILAVLP